LSYLKDPGESTPEKSPEKKTPYFTVLVTIGIRKIPVISFPGTFPGSLLFRGLFRGHYFSGDFSGVIFFRGLFRAHWFSGDYFGVTVFPGTFPGSLLFLVFIWGFYPGPYFIPVISLTVSIQLS
jgi:hypothetical protein